jgi:hypothetical protein
MSPANSGDVATHYQTKLSSADRVDHEQRRDGEDNLNGAVAEGGVERLLIGVVYSGEDGGTVERNDWGQWRNGFLVANRILNVFPPSPSPSPVFPRLILLQLYL